MSRRTILIIAATALAVIAAGAVLRYRGIGFRQDEGPVAHSGATVPIEATASYVGADACRSCHREASDAWQGSQHREAMQPASAASVKAPFDGGSFRYGRVTTRFFQRDGRYWVNTDGPDGRLADFEIKYAFGVYPLQQYLVELPQGRIQALSLAWDTRPKNAGGQRWFHLYPGQEIAHGDELHWTGRQQNWNFMCADCHSTNLRKNYDAASDSFRTTWSEINVACEACHGPGSRHLAWARQPTASAAAAGGDKGLTVLLDERRGVSWLIDSGTLKPVRSSARTTSREIDTCAQCHSRRSQIADGYRPGAALLDFYEPASLDAPLYFPDGQQRDEVYSYASFEQSRMAHAGVTCSDCHEPHAGTLRATGNALCTRCHNANRYDATGHHRHQPASAGTACVSCHMPARTYMQIDARRDHSLRVPRPDITITTGAPNACALCHTNRTAAWAAAAIKTWLGRDATGFQDFATPFHDADQRRTGAMPSLVDLATAANTPAIVRASAVVRLGEIGAPVSSVAGALGDADPLVRRSGLRAIEVMAPENRLGLVLPLLSDPIRSIRMAAARLLAPLIQRLGVDDRAAFDRAAAELTASAQFNADRPESRVSYGVFLADLGRLGEAEAEYRAAIKLGPDFAAGYINLAELLRTTKNESDAEQALRQGLLRMPGSPELHYALGLSLTRARRTAQAMAALKHAADLAPDSAQFSYAYALALNGAGQAAAAIRILTSALARHPDDHDMLLALAAFERDVGQLDAARRHAAQLLERYPNDADARALHESLRVRRE